MQCVTNSYFSYLNDKVDFNFIFDAVFSVICKIIRIQGSPVLGDRNTGILVLCTILVYKFVPVL
jgi:hypothetical protein